VTLSAPVTLVSLRKPAEILDFPGQGDR
jgi:hypothetical protein